MDVTSDRKPLESGRLNFGPLSRVAYCVTGVVVFGFLSFSIAKVVIGSIYYNDCPSSPLIPLFLLVGAFIPGLFVVNVRLRNENVHASIRRLGLLCTVLGILFSLAWLIIGTIWVIPTYIDVTQGNNSYNVTASGRNDTQATITTIRTASTQQATCDRTLIGFSFAVIVIDWILITFVICFACMLFYYLVCS
ncbi:hypothetical protein ScPMuIL_014191 [Solemya velum]